MTGIRYLVKSFIGTLFFGLFLFAGAGRFDYFQGYIYLAVSFTGVLVNFFLMKGNTELMNERSRPGKDMKKWDRTILALSAFLTLVTFIIAGLDSGRFHWTKQSGFTWCIAGALIMFCGEILFLIAKRENQFFSSVVRIQTDRGHRVCDSGIYKFVRHPGYLGMIISLAGFPFLLCSIYSIIPVAASIILIILRTALEDRLLISELEAYDAYASKTRFRLVPGLW